MPDRNVRALRSRGNPHPALERGGIERAWETIVPRELTRARTAPAFTRSRIERMLQLTYALCATVLGAQAALTLWTSPVSFGARLGVGVPVAITLVLSVVACVAGRHVGVACRGFAIVYPVAVLTMWALPDTGWHPAAAPWPFLLESVAAAAAVFAAPLIWQVAWALLMPVLWAAVSFDALLLVHVTREEASMAWMADMTLGILFNSIVVVLVLLLRALATGVDFARETAINEVMSATSADAAEAERLEIAALMHDSVLAALIAAERAESPRQEKLAVSMARDALTRLANAGSPTGAGSATPVDARELQREIEARLAASGIELRVTMTGPPGTFMPGRVARAITLASVQAVMNSVEHAHGVGLETAIHAHRGSVIVEVRDRGPGFDLGSVPADRLGIRGSIFARLAAVGAHVDLVSGRGGTLVRMQWSRRPGTDESTFAHSFAVQR